MAQAQSSNAVSATIDIIIAADPKSGPRPRLPAAPGRSTPGVAEVANARGNRSGERERVKTRLAYNLTDSLYENFDLFLYVSKAASGPWAQHMYVFRKTRSGDLDRVYDWPVSTGREIVEYNAAGARLPSYTPSGFFELDPRRFYRRHFSFQWSEPMPYAMFFNWVKQGSPTGLAIHGANGPEIAQLGTRASAGCIRLAPGAARTLFTLIRTQYRGLAPRFVVDRRTGTMNNDGVLLHNSHGRVRFGEGYRVLVLIENYGGQTEMATLY